MHILGLLLKTATGNQFVFIMTDLNSKLTRAVPTSKTSALHVPSIFCNHLIAAYKIPAYLLTNNGTQFVSQIFETICNYLGLKHSQPRMSSLDQGQAERYNRILISSLPNYVAEHHFDCNILVQTLTFAYNTEVNRSTGTIPFSLVLLRDLPGPITFDRLSALLKATNYATARSVLWFLLLQRIPLMRDTTEKNLSTMQRRYKNRHDYGVCPVTSFIPGQRVYNDCTPLSAIATDWLATDSYSKLLPQKLGPYCTLSVSAKSITIEEVGIPNTISPYCAFITPQSKSNASARSANAAS